MVIRGTVKLGGASISVPASEPPMEGSELNGGKRKVADR
jgi:hypothetical protein